MTYETLDNIRRHKDGSIDYAHYTKIGRLERSRETYRNVGAVSQFLRSLAGLFTNKKPETASVLENSVPPVSIRETRKAA